MATLARHYSLQHRLLISVTILLTVFLGFTGIVLDRAFRASVEASVADNLQVQLYVLLAAVDEVDGEFYFSENLREPRFTQLNSGLYGFISSADEGELLRTSSAIDLNFVHIPQDTELQRGETRFTRLTYPERGDFFSSTYAVTWENRPQAVLFTVLESSQTYQAEVTNFRTSLWSWLGGLALLLLTLQLLLLRWGLSPLRRMARDLAFIERGESDALDDGYPRELQALTQNLNLLIQSERKQQQRYRTTLGDLAHSLKTPLAVIQGEIAQWSHVSAAEAERAALIQEQLDRMTQLVTYQLQRAVRANHANVLARQVNIDKVADSLCRALEKVYADKAVVIQRDIDASLSFMGDERDLMEMLGNTLDNACKYGHGSVWLTSLDDSQDARNVILRIEDNGAGIAESERDNVLQRGVRLDSLAQGQGIGLAVVADIVSSYGGQIVIGNSPKGGARIDILLRNVRKAG